MANTKSAKKSIKVNERRRLRNLSARSAVKTAFRKANEAVTGQKGNEARLLVGAACSNIDSCVSKGIVHANTAARKKSRLALKLNKSLAAQ